MSDALSSAGGESSPAGADEVDSQPEERNTASTISGDAISGERTAADESNENPSRANERAKEQAKEQAKPAATKTPAQKQPQKHKVKIGGQEHEISYEELVRGYQNAAASTRRFQEASEKTKAYEELETALQKGDATALVKKLGYDKVRQMAVDLIQREIEWSELPEHERRARTLEQQIAEKDSRLREIEETEKKAKFEQAKTQAYKALDDEIGGLLSDEGPLSRLAPKQRTGFVRNVVDHMRAALDATGQPLSASDALKRTMTEYRQTVPTYLSNLDDSELREVIGDEVLKRIRKWDSQEIRARAAENFGKRDTQNLKEPPQRKSRFIRGSTDEAFAQIEKRLRG